MLEVVASYTRCSEDQNDWSKYREQTNNWRLILVWRGTPCWLLHSPAYRWGRGRTWPPAVLPGSVSPAWWSFPPCPPFEPSTTTANEWMIIIQTQSWKRWMLLHTSLRSRCSRVFMSSDLIRSLRAVSRSSSSSLMRDTIVAMRSFIWPRSAVCRSTTSWSSLTFPNTGSDSSSWFCEPSEALCRAYTDTHSSGSFQSTL